jgi:hypothetical protein
LVYSMADYELLNTPALDSDYIPPSSTPDVPPDYLIQSGGGLSNMHHGHPQGPYSATAARSDIYGMSFPFQTTGFAHATKSGLYGDRDMGIMAPRTCQECASLQVPAYAPQAEANVDYPYDLGPQVVYPLKKSSEPLTEGEDYTIIEPYDGSMPVKSTLGVEEKSKKLKDHPWLALIYVFLIFLALNLWLKLVNQLLEKYVFKTESATIKQLAITAVIATIILIIFALWLGSSLVVLEQDIEKSALTSKKENSNQ